MRGGPEEIDAAQEADEQRRIAERRQRAADIGDQDDEEDHHMGIVRAAGIGADQRPDQDHGGAGGADHARHGGAEQQDAGIEQRRAAQGAGNQDAAGHHIKREQQDDEAHIFRQHGVHEGGERGGCAERDGDRRQREQRPEGGDLAVMGVPEFREQQRAGGDAQQDAGERQRPRPAHGGAVERRRCVSGGRHEDGGEGGCGCFDNAHCFPVMAGTRVRPPAGPRINYVPGIHDLNKTWMAGTSPAMTGNWRRRRSGGKGGRC